MKHYNKATIFWDDNNIFVRHDGKIRPCKSMKEALTVIKEEVSGKTVLELDEYTAVMDNKVTGEEIEVKFIRFDDLEELLMKGMGEDLSDIEELTGTTGDGEEHKFNFDQIKDAIETMGCYGFARQETAEVLFWVDTDHVDPEIFVSMIAHEVGHIKRPWRRDDMKEEGKAEDYSIVATMAYRIKSLII
ncbi:MAG: hypothetical protein PVG39_07900 [Desulfobacteraceae bacterium]|jgi:hypothetical protein